MKNKHIKKQGAQYNEGTKTKEKRGGRKERRKRNERVQIKEKPCNK